MTNTNEGNAIFNLFKLKDPIGIDIWPTKILKKKQANFLTIHVKKLIKDIIILILVRDTRGCCRRLVYLFFWLVRPGITFFNRAFSKLTYFYLHWRFIYLFLCLWLPPHNLFLELAGSKSRSKNFDQDPKPKKFKDANYKHCKNNSH